MPLEVGQVLENKYVVRRLLGEGGMGAVYEGENMRIRRRVAIKALHANAASPQNVVRFEREAQAAGQIGNDHILEILDSGTLPDGQRFMVMEFLDGESLSSRLTNKGRLAPAEVVPIVAQVLVGLGAAHKAGIIHRDLKPDNVFILKSKANRVDFVKIIDFGISKFKTQATDMRMTQTGTVIGTPYYMSPEQAGGKGIDSRSDIYSVGVILYECVTGQMPHAASNYNDLIIKIVFSDPTPIRSLAPDLPEGLVAIIAKAMARDPEMRFQTTEEFAHALNDWASMNLSREGMMNLPHGAPLFRTPPPDLHMTTSQVGVVASSIARSPSESISAAGVPAARRSRRLGIVLAIAGMVACGGVGWVVSGRRSPRAETSASSAAPAAALTPHAPEPSVVETAKPPAELVPIEPPMVAETPTATAPLASTRPLGAPPRPRAADTPNRIPAAKPVTNGRPVHGAPTDAPTARPDFDLGY